MRILSVNEARNLTVKGYEKQFKKYIRQCNSVIESACYYGHYYTNFGLPAKYDIIKALAEYYADKGYETQVREDTFGNPDVLYISWGEEK